MLDGVKTFGVVLMVIDQHGVVDDYHRGDNKEAVDKCLILSVDLSFFLYDAQQQVPPRVLDRVTTIVNSKWA